MRGIAVSFILIALGIYFIGVVKVLLLGGLAAAALAALLRPMAVWVPGPRALGAVVVGLGVLVGLAGTLVAAVWLVVHPLREQMKDWPATRGQIEQRLDQWGGKVGWDVPSLDTLSQKAAEWVVGGGGKDLLGTGLGAVANGGVAVLIVVVGAMYILAMPGGVGEVVRPALRGVSRRRRSGVLRLIRDLDAQLRGWALGTLVAMASAAVFGWLGYRLIGLRFAEGVALLAGIGELVPNLGPIAAFVVALAIGVTQSWMMVVWVVVVYAITQGVQSYWIQPVVMKKAVKIPEVVTLFTVVAWGIVFGAAGLVMAVPLNLLLWGIWTRVVRGERQ